METPPQPAPQPVPVPAQITTMPKPAGHGGRLLGVLMIVVLVGGAGYWAWQAGYVAEFGKFFAAEPGTSEMPLVKLFPVINEDIVGIPEDANKVRGLAKFTLDPGNVEVTAVQLDAVITGGTFLEATGLVGSDAFPQVLEQASLDNGGTTLHYTVGINAGATGVTVETVIATIPFYLVPDSGADQICISVDVLKSIVTAKDLDDNQLDKGLVGWSNNACVPLVGSTATPEVTATVEPTATATATGAPSETRVPKPGDTDHDGDVDIFDFNTVVAQFGRTGKDLPGDVDGNGKVDIFDFNLIVEKFESKIR